MNSVFLYQFLVQGSYYRVTSQEQAVTFESNTYSPAVIGHGNTSSQADVSKSTLEVRLGLNESLSTLLRTAALTSFSSVTVFRLVDGISAVWWKGRIVGLGPEGLSLKLTCDSLLTALSRPGLRRVASRSCTHPLYSKRCGVGRTDLAWGVSFPTPFSAIVQEQVGPAEYRVDWASTDPAAGILAGGFCVVPPNPQKRTTLSHSGNVLKLGSPLAGEPVGQFVNFVPGCDKSLATCHNRFNNHLNFGALPELPITNPFSGTDSL